MNQDCGGSYSHRDFVKMTGLYKIEGEYYLRFDQLRVSMSPGTIKLIFMAKGETIITKEYPLYADSINHGDTLTISDLYAFTKLGTE
jgi:hypothetical protein